MQIKKIFFSLFLALLLLTNSANAQQRVQLNAHDYVVKLHGDADKVQTWCDKAIQRQEKVKAAELNKRVVELRAIVSMMDALINVADKSKFDEPSFARANDRFNRTYREADLITRLEEQQIVEMKKVDDEQLLNQDVGVGEGAYTTERLMYDNANADANPDSSAENS